MLTGKSDREALLVLLNGAIEKCSFIPLMKSLMAQVNQGQFSQIMT